VGCSSAFVRAATGTVDLSVDEDWPQNDGTADYEPFSIGDIDGDGYPEVVFANAGYIFGKRLDGPKQGETVHRWEVMDRTWGGLAPTALADFNGDGVYEVVVLSTGGLYVFSGITGETLWSAPTIRTCAAYASPLIADVDGDGSMELVVIGDEITDGGEPSMADCNNDTVFIFGAAAGRFARGRPVWNQVPYDITSVQDDGTIVEFPVPSWKRYNAWRAQPAHDGEHPDLAPRVLDTCSDTCASGGEVTLTAMVDNLGSTDAPAGAVVTLSTWAGPEVWPSEVAHIVLDAPIPAGGSSAELEFTLPWEQWKDARVLEVEGAHPDECNYVNDRIDVVEDPCAR